MGTGARRGVAPRRRGGRPRPGSGVLGAIGLGLGLALALGNPVGAQEPRPDDPQEPEVRDTLAAPDSAVADTAAADSAAADSAAVTVPQLIVVGARDGGWAASTWEWDRQALLAGSAFTLTDLLERVPGIIPVRYGYFGMPESAAAFGATGGRLEIVLDGYVLDPLDASTLDLAGIRLNALRRVRVERRLDRLRVELETLAASDPRPYSQIEAATGERLNTDLLRGTVLAPNVLGGPLGAGIERLATDGLRRRERAVAFGGWFTWGLIRSDSSGIQLEHRRHRLTRDQGGPFAGEDERTDWILRARAMPLPRLRAEAYIGASSLDRVVDSPAATGPPGDDSENGDGLEDGGGEHGSVQSGVRAFYDGERSWGRGALRFRTGDGLPRFVLDLGAGLRLPGAVRFEGDLRSERWTEGARATSVGLRAGWRPADGVDAFVELSSGARGVPFLTDSAGAPVLTDRTSARVGADYVSAGWRAGVAALHLAADSVPTFGLPFDRTGRRYPGGTVQGWEASARVPLPWDALALEGSYTGWVAGTSWLYLPSRSWRAGLAFHDLPLASGNLELFARLEAHHRGPMLVPTAADAPEDVPPLQLVPELTGLDFSLQIRILSVRAFVRWDNILHRTDLFDLPGRILPGQRLWYGVKWEFWN